MPAPDGAGVKILITALIALSTITVSPTTTAHKTLEIVEAAGIVTIVDTDVAWALGRFADAGLDLPDVDVTFSADREECGGNVAVAVHGAEPRIVVCTTDEASTTVIHRTLLHELAHVWAKANLDDETRAAFMALRGLDAWDSGRWDGRGSEHAAEIITWALMDGKLLMATLADHDPASLATGYELLTGEPTRSVG